MRHESANLPTAVSLQTSSVESMEGPYCKIGGNVCPQEGPCQLRETVRPGSVHDHFEVFVENQFLVVYRPVWMEDGRREDGQVESLERPIDSVVKQEKRYEGLTFQILL